MSTQIKPTQVWQLGTVVWLVDSVGDPAGYVRAEFLDDLAPIEPERREAVARFIADRLPPKGRTSTIPASEIEAGRLIGRANLASR